MILLKDIYKVPKKVSDKQKQEILVAFKNGTNIKEISISFDFTVSTITRQLKNILGDKKFAEIRNSKSAIINKQEAINDQSLLGKSNEELLEKSKNNKEVPTYNEEELFNNDFYEIAPLNDEIDLEKQKNITAKPIEKFNLPDVVFMIVDKNIELEPQLLKDYPEWDFLPYEDLNKTTLKIFSDNKTAKKICSQNQKIIKINNPNVFIIASKFLKRKGISMLIYYDNLLNL